MKLVYSDGKTPCLVMRNITITIQNYTKSCVGFEIKYNELLDKAKI